MSRYFYWLFMSCSLTLNALLGGQPYQTLCARFYSLAYDVNGYRRSRVFFAICWAIDKLDYGHCYRAFRTTQLIQQKLRIQK